MEGSEIIRDTSTERKYFTILPNIIFEKKLTPLQFELYCLYKRIAGENGECYYTTENLAEMLGCNKSSISRARKCLEAQGLIIRGQRKVASGRMVDEVRIVDVWPENLAALRCTTVPQVLHQETASVAPGNRKKNQLIRTSEEEDISAAVFKTYVDNFALLTDTVKDMLGSLIDDYGAPQVLEAMNEAVRYNKRSLAYVEGILKAGGKTKEESDRRRYIEGEFAQYVES